MAVDQRSPAVEVEEGGATGGESGDGSINSVGRTDLSGLTVNILRKIIADEIRNAISHVGTLPLVILHLGRV